MTTTQLDPVLTPAPVARIVPRVAADSRYVLTGLPLAAGALLVPVTALAIGAGLAVAWVGLPLMMFAVMQARGFAVTERERVAVVLGQEIPHPDYRTVEASSLPGKLLSVLRDRQTWRDLAHAAFRWIPSTVAFTLVATWWAAILGGLSWALWGWALPEEGVELPELIGLGDGYPTMIGFHAAVAMVFVLTLPPVARWAARLEARFAERLLAPRPRSEWRAVVR
ncbi:MAG TPA: sensor domain-containing protein [Actinoplanes sp.]|nr:sensor domain-containing protein [Actinoplanes sp.]